MNLKDRLTSTENLLRSIRSGEAFSSSNKDKAVTAESSSQGSIWTRRLSLGDVFSGLMGRAKAPKTPSAPQTAAARPASPPKASAPLPPQGSPPPRPPVAQRPSPQDAPPPAYRDVLPDVLPDELPDDPPGITVVPARSNALRAAQRFTPPQAPPQTTGRAPAPQAPAPRPAQPAAQQPAPTRPKAPEQQAPPAQRPAQPVPQQPAPQQAAPRPPQQSAAPAPEAAKQPQRPAAPTRPGPGVEAVRPPVAPAVSRALEKSRAQAPLMPPKAPVKAAAAGTSIWKRPISLGDTFSSLFGRKAKRAPETFQAPASATARAAANKPASPLAAGAVVPVPPDAAAPATSSAGKPFWSRQINFGRRARALSVGVSISGPFLCLAVVRSGAIVAARRFSMTPDQAPGESGFAALLRGAMQALGLAAGSAEIWAVLRSADLDLNVLSVPKLSGPKLDAAVYWTLQKEKKFAEAEYVLDYLVLGPTAETKEPRLDALTCLARRADVERLREAFRDAGFPLTGITSIPNAFLSLYRLPGGPRGFSLAANIHVEPDFSAIGLYTQDRLVFSRFIRSGAGSMADTLVEHFQKLAKPRPLNMDDLELPLPSAPRTASPSAAPLAQPLDSNQAQALMRHVLLGAPRPSFASSSHLLSPEEMLEILSPAIERLARQVERTLDYYSTTQQARCDVLHLSGEIFTSPDIVKALGAQLGFAPVAFDATRILGSGGGLVSPADRMTLGPALAAALALPGKGVNLLHNYKVRTSQEAKRKVTSSLVLGLAAVMLVIGGASLVLEQANAEKKLQLGRLRTQLVGMGLNVDEGSLTTSVGQYRQRQDTLREAANRLLAPAALSEITLRAPENVKIVSLTVNYPEPAQAPAPGTPAKPAPPPAPAQPGAAVALPQGTVTIEGVVTGDKVEFDANLSRFVLSLQSSPMFHLPVVDESGLRDLGTRSQVLRFVMHLGVK